jgi:hypothetical protein
VYSKLEYILFFGYFASPTQNNTDTIICFQYTWHLMAIQTPAISHKIHCDPMFMNHDPTNPLVCLSVRNKKLKKTNGKTFNLSVHVKFSSLPLFRY